MTRRSRRTRTKRSQLWNHIATPLRRGLRFAGLVAHVSIGLGIITFRFPRYTDLQRRLRIQRWAAQLNKLLGIRVIVHGQPPLGDRAALLLANHVSWFDIFALNSVRMARFVAKSDVKSWPVIGRLCHGTGTLFIERKRKQDTLRANLEIATCLREGHLIAVFPEGTTSDGMSLKPFRSSLLQPAVDNNCEIRPVYLRYLDANGHPSTLAAYHDNTSFGRSLWQLLGARGLTIELHYLPSVTPDGNKDRRTLTRQIENAMRHLQEKLQIIPINQ